MADGTGEKIQCCVSCSNQNSPRQRESKFQNSVAIAVTLACNFMISFDILWEKKRKKKWFLDALQTLREHCV